MKEFELAIVGTISEIIHTLIASLVLFLAWNEVVPELFHYKDITFVQSLWITCAVRVLTNK